MSDPPRPMCDKRGLRTVRRELIPGKAEYVAFTPETPGAYYYRCTTYSGLCHATIFGQIIVTARRWARVMHSRSDRRRGGEVTQEHRVLRGIARALLSALAAGALVATGAMAAGMPVVHAAAHSADVTILGGKKGGGSMDFNGFQRGAMTVTVPVGWQVVMHFENADTPLPHSLAVMPAGAHQQVAPSGAPAFPGATTANFAAGLPKGGKQTFTFEASKAGTYDFVCGVPGHAVSGMWDSLVVSGTADAPSVTPPGAATISAQ